MPARDIYHNAVKNALIKDGWRITADPYVIKYEDAELYADLAAERPIERGDCAMDKLERYRSIIKKLLAGYHQLSQPSLHSKSDVEELVSFDEERDHYFWFSLGWQEKQRIQSITMYLRIKDEKIWVEEDQTDLCVVDDLLTAGIPKEDIVLGFHHPSKRKFTEFAIAP